MVSPLNWKIDGGMLQVFLQFQTKENSWKPLKLESGLNINSTKYTQHNVHRWKRNASRKTKGHSLFTMHFLTLLLGGAGVSPIGNPFLPWVFTIGYAMHESECGYPNFPTCVVSHITNDICQLFPLIVDGLSSKKNLFPWGEMAYELLASDKLPEIGVRFSRGTMNGSHFITPFYLATLLNADCNRAHVHKLFPYVLTLHTCRRCSHNSKKSAANRFKIILFQHKIWWG